MLNLHTCAMTQNSWITHDTMWFKTSTISNIYKTCYLYLLHENGKHFKSLLLILPIIIQDNFLIAKRKFSCQNLDLLLTKLQDLSDQYVTKAKRQKRNVLISVLPCSCQERALLFIVSASRLPWPWYNKPLITNDYNLYPARVKTGKMFSYISSTYSFLYIVLL